MVSIIVPVYNMEKLLKKCIDSILGQTYGNFELLLIDDGSTDRSGLICDGYQKRDSRVRVFHKKNGGIGSATNVGLEAACGDYIAFVDSDDYISSVMLERLLNLLKSSDADISQCDRYKFSSITGIDEVPQRGETFLYQTNDELIDDFFHYRKIPRNLAARLFKAEIFSDVRCVEGRQVVDIVTLPLLLQKCNRYVLTSEKHYYAYENPKSISRGVYSNQVHDDFVYSISFFENFINKYYPKHKDYLLYRKVTGAIYGYYGIRNNNYFENKKVEEQFCVKIFRDNYKKFKESVYYNEQSLKLKMQIFLFNFSPRVYSFLKAIINELYNIHRRISCCHL